MSSHPKKIGFLSFGHWHPASETRSAAESLRQTVELAVAAEEIGIDGAFVRVHHFARQLSAPFPLLSAIGVRTHRIEIGTGVIDMRYENPLYMAEDAAVADLLSGGRLQLGVSRGSPEHAWQGAETFGYSVDPDEARAKTELFRAAIAGAGVARADAGGRPGETYLPIQPHAPGLSDRIWWGSGTRETAVWTGEQGMNLMSSTLLLEDTQVPFDELQAEQIRLFHEAWEKAGHEREPRVSVSRSVIPIISDLDRQLFGSDDNQDQVGWLDGAISRFGRTYTGEPDRTAEELAQDVAVQAADTILLTVPNALGVEYNANMLATIAREIAPAIGWKPSHLREQDEAVAVDGLEAGAASLDLDRVG
ncbi:MAG: LLM class flavin-dependent oxidoreductase [Actinobacteria bacterium]|nr:LLM class flavin-dependent oxidoreductase [Actinomycetota bacterium]